MGSYGLGALWVSHRRSFGLLQDFGVGAGGSAGVGGETYAGIAEVVFEAVFVAVAGGKVDASFFGVVHRYFYFVVWIKCSL